MLPLYTSPPPSLPPSSSALQYATSLAAPLLLSVPAPHYCPTFCLGLLISLCQQWLLPVILFQLLFGNGAKTTNLNPGNYTVQYILIQIEQLLYCIYCILYYLEKGQTYSKPPVLQCIHCMTGV